MMRPHDRASLDRRRSERLARNVSVFVYGHTPNRKPFHEEATTLEISSRGSLLTLAANVFVGQKLLLTNIANREETECSVVRFTPRNQQKIVAVEFAESVPDFWQPGNGHAENDAGQSQFGSTLGGPSHTTNE
jgi:hypothetical protein